MGISVGVVGLGIMDSARSATRKRIDQDALLKHFQPHSERQPDRSKSD